MCTQGVNRFGVGSYCLAHFQATITATSGSEAGGRGTPHSPSYVRKRLSTY